MVGSIHVVGDRLPLLYQPGLLPPTRHWGTIDGFRRGADRERRWQDLPVGAEVLFCVPDDSPCWLPSCTALGPRHRRLAVRRASAPGRVVGVPVDEGVGDGVLVVGADDGDDRADQGSGTSYANQADDDQDRCDGDGHLRGSRAAGDLVVGGAR